MITSAYISSDGKYRYNLLRAWGDGPRVTFVGLNPSTADANNDDPTIRRCMNFAKDWGYGSLVMLNLFAYRATDPKRMKGAHEPVGVYNNDALLNASDYSSKIICCWGNHGGFNDRSDFVMRNLLRKTYAFKITKQGEPSHPLYLKSDTKPFLWSKNKS